MAVPLKTTPQIRALAPEPPATVCVQNLHLTLTHAGHDAWGRAGKSQPCTISVEVGFAERFSTAAASDRLGEDTVHYGTLSKVVLGSVARFEEGSRQHALGQGERGLMHVLEHVWRDLTGLKLDGTEVKVAGETPLIDIAKVQFLSLTVGLPKASLLGDGVALRASAVVDPSLRRVSARALALEITRLKVPTLIGVNANERLAKQFVVVTVTIEKFDQSEDIYPGVEAAVVKALEESSFETLEALGAYLAEKVLSSPTSEEDWLVHIKMEKPTAVSMADCPIVEVRATRESLQKVEAAGVQ